MNMRNLFLVVLFFLLNTVVYYVTQYYSENKIDMVLEKNLRMLETHYKVLLKTQETTASTIYKSTMAIDRVVKIIAEANSATNEKKLKLRDELHHLLYEKYQIIKEKGVLQYQFLLVSNESFYRAHKPSKFGDDLTNVREDFKYTNRTKSPTRGFVQGRVAHGFRNTFPIFDKEKNHVGAMEVSFSSDRFQWYLNNVSNIHSHFIVDKGIFDAKTWKRDDLILKYAKSSEDENFMIALEGIHTKEKCIAENKIKLNSQQDIIKAKMKRGIPFSLYAKHDEHMDAISFLPIHNLSLKTVAWIISYEKSAMIQDTLKSRFHLRVIGFLVSFLLVYFLYRMMESKKKIHQQKIEVEKQQHLLNEILDTTDNIMFITDFKEIKFSNNKFNELKHHSIPNLFLEAEGYLHKGLLEENESFVSLIQRTKVENRIVSIMDEHFESKAFTIGISKLECDDDYLISLADITKIKEEFAQTEKKAYIDGLTNIYNRNKLNDLFEEELKRLKRYPEPLSVALLDIDKFKDFNDTYGHLIGDEVLITMAHTVNKAVRETDVFARWGGEEFMILFINTNIDRAIEVAEKLKDIIEESEHERAGKITSSFGLTEYKEGDSMDSLFKRCDDALYIAKENGRNRVEVL